MNYSQTISYLFNALPMFQRVGKEAYKPDLTNIAELCHYLGDPQDSFPSIHLAGTNGKGSTSHMLAAVLQHNGYRTGLFTSPHLKDFRERIRINGKMIPKSAITRFVHDHWAKIDATHPSFFEMTVALAFDWFAESNIDIAVIETGLGGRLDSTNIISPLVSVITNIGYDHTNILGEQLAQIAGEKAGIIKLNTPAIIGEYMEETAGVFEQKAAGLSSSLHFASRDWKTTSWTPGLASQQMILTDLNGVTAELKLDLPGHYQVKNVKTVLSTLTELRKLGIRVDNPEKALDRVKKLTGLKGRWYILSRHPLTICDTGHNAEGIREVVAQIAATPHANLHIVFGVVNDKDVKPILELLPARAKFYFCQAAIPRALDAVTLQQAGTAAGLQGESYASVDAALKAARTAAGAEDLIFIGGSTFVVAEIIP